MQVALSIRSVPVRKFCQLVEDGGPGLGLGSTKLPQQVAAESATPHLVQVQFDEVHTGTTGGVPNASSFAEASGPLGLALALGLTVALAEATSSEPCRTKPRAMPVESESMASSR